MRAHSISLGSIILGLVAGCSCVSPSTVDTGPDVPGLDAPALDVPRTDVPGADVPRADVPGADVPRADTPELDAPGGCESVRLQAMPIAQLRLLDAIAPDASRSLRVQADYIQNDSCHRRAMTGVTIRPESRTVDIIVRDWVAEGRGCLEVARDDARTITIRPLAPGSWTIRDASPGGTATLPITVMPGVGTPCMPGGPGGCVQDCDCGFGEACLSGSGIAGPFLACATPCEEDFDCDGERCVSVDDGLDLACESGSPACDASRACPTGYACTAGRCAASFTLGMSTRHTCTCDSECDPGLSCVHGPTSSRCEVACATGGAWCAGPHFCAEAEQDIAGIAADDAVCGWVGE